MLIFHIIKSVRIIKSLNSELQHFITKFDMGKNKLTESREKSNSFSALVVERSLPDACDKRIKKRSKERIESLTRVI